MQMARFLAVLGLCSLIVIAVPAVDSSAAEEFFQMDELSPEVALSGRQFYIPTVLGPTGMNGWMHSETLVVREVETGSPADGIVLTNDTIHAANGKPLGAEPLLLEALELGMSEESAFLADVLHVAQVEEFEATGELIAVSEMPIRREPWFIYLGLQLGREAREWGIDVVDGVEQYRTREFLEQNMALSSKAAYLWAAYRPGPYADALVAFVRERGRLPIGFASNVGRVGGGAATTFTDLNTNAVILQAIAHRLDAEGVRPQP